MTTAASSASSSGLDVEATAIAHLRKQLDNRGYPHADLTELRDLAIRSANADFRAIAPRPRHFHMPAPPFAVAPQLLQGFTELQLAVTSGQDLTYFQSKSRLRADFHDHLLSDWRIHHFHLGAGPDARDARFIARTGPVLFAFVTDQHFLALGIDDHGAWSDPQLLEILHRQWPSAIASYRVDEKVTGALKTEAEIAGFRKAGINGAVQLTDGTVYHSPNFGRTTDGTPMLAVQAANFLVATVRHMQRHIDDTLPTKRGIVADERGVNPDALVFQVAIVRAGDVRAPGFWLDETTTGYGFHLQSPPGVNQPP